MGTKEKFHPVRLRERTRAQGLEGLPLNSGVEDPPLEIIALAAAKGRFANPALYLGFGESR
jgi:hypothetical protein